MYIYIYTYIYIYIGTACETDLPIYASNSQKQPDNLQLSWASASTRVLQGTPIWDETSGGIKQAKRIWMIKSTPHPLNSRAVGIQDMAV